eukprot:gene13820-15265_t
MEVRGSCCSHEEPNKVQVRQSIDEMDFERGIWQAALDGNRERVQKLLDKGHSPDMKDASGYTALHYASRAGHTDIVKLLFQFKADANARTASGKDCPIHRAAYQGHSDVIKLLLDHGADPLLQNADGQTALHKATERRRDEVIELLLKICPKLKDVKDNRGRTAFECD